MLWGYLRGRLILAGTDIETLSFDELLDVTHATLLDSPNLGSYEKLDKRLREPPPLREVWGTGSAADAQAEIETMAAPVVRLSPEEITARRAARETMPPDGGTDS